MSQETKEELFRQIPAVDQVLLRTKVQSWIANTSHLFVVSEIQQLFESIRDSIRSGAGIPRFGVDMSGLESELERRLLTRLRPALGSVINATGVILHTNLGRAPLSAAARESLSALSGQYTNLEYDLAGGERSHRDKLLDSLLGQLLGCESATVVNNNAAAVFLIVKSLASGREVVVSRGELIEIGGSFRIPEIIAESGAALREVGTTNKTRVPDYRAAIGPNTGLLLRVHPSNYRVEGFTERPALREMVELARDLNVPLVEDIGSGTLVDLTPFGIADEPIAHESLAAGVDLVCFSGDKLLGGPQAGIIAGKRALVDVIRRNPLMRVCRVEKLIYGALEATLASYHKGRAFEEIPVLKMLSASQQELRQRARRFQKKLNASAPGGATAGLVDGQSVLGGGSCPGAHLPTTLIAMESERHGPDEIASRLRTQNPPVIVRIENDKALVDLRTVFPSQESLLLEALCNALS
jgi:L-seryl-tRNA(Ser) seleniumtransferase